MTDDPLDAPAQPDLWSCIRRDFLAGEPASLLAERYAISERTIRRRAAIHGWRRRDRDSDAGSTAGLRARSIDEVIADHPTLKPIAEINTEDMANLLLTPDPHLLRRFAFKRAAEEAAQDRPAGCLAWMRIVQAMDRSGERITREDWHFSTADRIRASFLEAAENYERSSGASADGL